MEWMGDNLPSLLVVLGIVLVVIEVGVLGFSVFLLFFVGLASVVTGVVMMAGLIPETLMVAFGCVAVLSMLFAVLLWKPLNKLQNSGEQPKDQGYFIGYSFVLDADISATHSVPYKYSGITWKLKSETPLSAGTNVEVIKAEVGELTVAEKTN